MEQARKEGGADISSAPSADMKDSPADYEEMAGIWGNGEQALPGDPPGGLQVVDGLPEGGKIHDLTGVASAFTSD